MSPDPRVAKTRQRVLDAAWELLTEVGFDGVTIELVSTRSGVARSTLYRHWHTKSEILRDAFSVLGGADADAPNPAPAPAPAPARLAAYATTVALGLTDLWGRAALTLAVSALDDDDQRAVRRTFTDGTRRDLLAILTDALTTGELPAGSDLPALLERAVDLVQAPLFYRYAFDDRPVTAEDAAFLGREAWGLLTQQASTH